MSDETVLNNEDARLCKDRAESVARTIVTECKHLPGPLACKTCIQLCLESFLRRLTYRFRREGVGP